MIRLRPGLLVSAHMIVGIELSTDDGNPCINVHTPDGAFWSISEAECNMPINETTLIALGAEIDKQCREIGAAGVVSDQVKRMIDNRVELETQFARKEPINFARLSRDLDDEPPF